MNPGIVGLTEFDAIRSAAGNCAGLTILDLGCGAGQPVATFAKARRVYGVDCSMQDLTPYHNPQSANIVRLQGTALCLPFADGMFDVVLAAQLLSHLVPEQRVAALQEIARVVKPDGKIILTALHYNFRFPKLGMPKSGVDEGVYFFRHTVAEFREEIGTCFHIEYLWGVWNYLPKTYQLFLRLGRKTLYWDRIVRRTPFSLRYGKHLLAVCHVD